MEEYDGEHGRQGTLSRMHCDWVVERDFAWAARFRRLARDYERLAQTLAGYHLLAFAMLMLHKLASLLVIV